MWDIPPAERLAEGGTWVLAELSSPSQTELTEAAADFRRIGKRLRSFGRALGVQYTTTQINSRDQEGEILMTRWEVRFRGHDAESDLAAGHL